MKRLKNKVGYVLVYRYEEIRKKLYRKIKYGDCSLLETQISFIYPYLFLRIIHFYMYIITISCFNAFISLVRLLIYSYLGYRFISYKLLIVISVLFFIYLYLEYYIFRKEGHSKKNSILYMSGVVFKDADNKYEDVKKMLKEIEKQK